MKNFHQIKNYLIGIPIALAIGAYGVNYFYTTTNERSFLGMDKAGRQIFIQSLDHYAKSVDTSVSIDSDWKDFSLIQRLWQEPMRTTLRIYKTMNEEEYQKFQIGTGLADIIPSDDVENSLKTPYKDFLQNYSSEISMSENSSITPEDLEKLADEKKVITYRDLLRGFGFKKYEYYVNGNLVSSIDLNPNIKNHTEGNFSSTVGSTENAPL